MTRVIRNKFVMMILKHQSIAKFLKSEKVHRENKNIIIYGIRESQETEAIDRKKDVTKIVGELCEFVNVDAGIIKNVVRLVKESMVITTQQRRTQIRHVQSR